MFRVQKRERPHPKGGGESKENDHFAFAHITLRCLLQFDLLSFSDTSWILYWWFWGDNKRTAPPPKGRGKTATPTKGGGKGSTTKKKRRPTNTTQNCSLRSSLLGGADFSLLSLGKFSINKRNQDFLSFKNSSIGLKKKKNPVWTSIFFFFWKGEVCIFWFVKRWPPRESGNDDRQEKTDQDIVVNNVVAVLFFLPERYLGSLSFEEKFAGWFLRKSTTHKFNVAPTEPHRPFFFLIWCCLVDFGEGAHHTNLPTWLLNPHPSSSPVCGLFGRKKIDIVCHCLPSCLKMTINGKNCKTLQNITEMENCKKKNQMFSNFLKKKIKNYQKKKKNKIKNVQKCQKCPHKMPKTCETLLKKCPTHVQKHDKKHAKQCRTLKNIAKTWQTNQKQKKNVKNDNKKTCQKCQGGKKCTPKKKKQKKSSKNQKNIKKKF